MYIFKSLINGSVIFKIRVTPLALMYGVKQDLPHCDQDHTEFKIARLQCFSIN